VAHCQKLQHCLTPLTLIIVATAALRSGGPLKLFVVRPVYLHRTICLALVSCQHTRERQGTRLHRQSDRLLQAGLGPPLLITIFSNVANTRKQCWVSVLVRDNIEILIENN